MADAQLKATSGPRQAPTSADAEVDAATFTHARSSGIPSTEGGGLHRLLVESVQDYAIFALDSSGRILSWNPGAQRLKGYQTEEILGRHFSIFYQPEDVAAGKPQRELEIATRDGRVDDEGWRVRKDGSLFWANVVITALRESHPRPHRAPRGR
jgi:PAS domain S-box-containing protein